MASRFSPRERSVFLLGWRSGSLVFLLSISLFACNIIPVKLDCSGVNVTCRIGKPTILSPDATAQARAVATVETVKNSRPLLNDPLRNQDRNNWGTTAVCSFHEGAYFLAVTNFPGTESCGSSAFGGHLGDAAVQINVTLYAEGSSAGLLLRATADQNEYYAFMINGSQFFLGLFGKDDTLTNVIPYTNSPIVHDLGQENTLLVIARGDDFSLFINGKFVAEGYDSTLANGYVGVVLSHESSAKARFSNLVVYPS